MRDRRSVAVHSTKPSRMGARGLVLGQARPRALVASCRAAPWRWPFGAPYLGIRINPSARDRMSASIRRTCCPGPSTEAIATRQRPRLGFIGGTLMTKPDPPDPQTYEEWLAEAAKKAEAAAQASRLFNVTAVDRILDAVGKRHWPATLNRETLTADLERVAQIYPIWHSLDHRPSDRATLERIERVNSTARRLDKLLPAPDCSTGQNGDPLMRLLLTAVDDGCDVSRIRDAIAGVSLIVARSDKILRGFRGLGWRGRRSAESWLISEALPKIYEGHFARPFRISRDKATRQPSGPGIRFVVSVLSVMGVVTRDRKPYGPAAVEPYLR